jgi:hypothetical protein
MNDAHAQLCIYFDSRPIMNDAHAQSSRVLASAYLVYHPFTLSISSDSSDELSSSLVEVNL